MQSRPSAEHCAGAILSILVLHFASRPGDTLRSISFDPVWRRRGYRATDFESGVGFAIKHDWLEALSDGKSYRLNKKGHAAA